MLSRFIFGLATPPSAEFPATIPTIPAATINTSSAAPLKNSPEQKHKCEHGHSFTNTIQRVRITLALFIQITHPCEPHRCPNDFKHKCKDANQHEPIIAQKPIQLITEFILMAQNLVGVIEPVIFFIRDFAKEIHYKNEILDVKQRFNHCPHVKIMFTVSIF
jgi:hypothetical protein